MADKKTSQENPAGTLHDDDAIRLARAGDNYRTTPEDIAEYTEKWLPRTRTIDVGDETTALTTGAAKKTFHWWFTGQITAMWVGLSTPQASGSVLTFDVNDGVSSMFSTPITVDNTEDTSLTASTPAVLSDTLVTRGGKAVIDIDQVGDGTGKGLKLYVEYRVYNGGSP